MTYKKPAIIKQEKEKPPITSNFAPPPVEQGINRAKTRINKK